MRAQRSATGATSAAKGAVLVAERVEMTFVSPDSSLEALAEATVALAPNEFVSIIGPSGCGKSTLLRILAGLVRPTGGRVLLHGQPLTHPHRQIGVVFQHANLMPWRSALRNVTLPLEIQGIAADIAERRGREMLELVGLADFADALPRDLSGGMRQRVALARALVHDPEVLLLDEPFGALDALTRERMNWELLRIWEARRKTVLMVTHDIQEAIFTSDRVLVMTARPGHIRAEVAIDLPRPRSPEDLYSPRFMELSHTLRDLLR
ncbi:MAG TPA: ABC transporter ATP-binding protein [Chloroflexi bacterium]|jgi:NitT/TauT family transport system ATP-binding protein|nr:ABC transporter ATP-binding protein [Chloroflexota bacterium]